MRTALSIAGSDSGGGAGIQADIKTMTMNGVFAMTAITALTAQNTEGVKAIMDVTPAFLKQQIDAVFEDIYPDAVKIHGNFIIPRAVPDIGYGSLAEADMLYPVTDRIIQLIGLCHFELIRPESRVFFAQDCRSGRPASGFRHFRGSPETITAGGLSG